MVPTPVEYARSRLTVKRSKPAGWAGYGYCPSHSCFFWGLRLHLLRTPGGLPVARALVNPKTDEREVLADMLTQDADLPATHPGQTVIGDKGYISKPSRANSTSNTMGPGPLPGVLARVGQRVLAPAAAIWHNRANGAPLTRSLIAYDH
ncbi:hypothetical protein ACFVZS_17720 [Streptomyces abikoensis]|uniref:hypothetical protein n=1 Tax=Streptomyces abikoensis TaxID=97398 RepID=UPI0036BDDAF5